MKAETTEIEELIIMCRELLKAVNKLSMPPLYIVQPFLGIIRDHYKLINKLNLIGDDLHHSKDSI
jgi:hypothetical protein